MNKLLVITMAVFLASFSACNSNIKKNKTVDAQQIEISKQKLESTLQSVKSEFKRIRHRVIRPAEGYLKYPYLIPSGFYSQMWDWDGFFMGNYFASQGKPEYLKYWALNLIKGIDDEGYVSGCATTKGPRPIFGKFAMKPFLSQGVYLASKKMNDFSWVKEHYQALMKVLEYRDKTQLDTTYNLYYWDNAMQSGADNNPALNYFWKEDKRSFLACDASTFQLREILAQSKIAEKLGKTEDAEMLLEKAKRLKIALNKYLWCDEDKMYYNVDRETGNFYKRVSYSCFVPLMQNLASIKNGRAMIEKYLLNPGEMKAKYGFRSLSKQDPDFNNKNIIIPFSNWQGPVWPLSNYIYSIGLKNYDFEKELEWQAQTLGTIALKDIKTSGSMHECYNGDTGETLSPSADHVDKDGNYIGFISWDLCIQNMLEGVIENKWMLLEIE